MGLNIKRNSKGQYNMKSTISDEQIHEKNGFQKKKPLKN
jgi:hypothetical protein